jgi:hypothetical protein
MAAPPMVMSSSAAPSLTHAYSDSASPLEEVLLSFIAAEINPKTPETYHGRPLQPVFDAGTAALIAKQVFEERKP